MGEADAEPTVCILGCCVVCRWVPHPLHHPTLSCCSYPKAATAFSDTYWSVVAPVAQSAGASLSVFPLKIICFRHRNKTKSLFFETLFHFFISFFLRFLTFLNVLERFFSGHFCPKAHYVVSFMYSTTICCDFVEHRDRHGQIRTGTDGAGSRQDACTTGLLGEEGQTWTGLLCGIYLSM